MNIDEFLDKLAKQRYTKEWRLIVFDRIRSNRQCPISSLMNRDAWEYTSVGEKLGIDDVDIGEIIEAADSSFPATPLRKKMLNVLGLTEVQTTFRHVQNEPSGSLPDNPLNDHHNPG